MLEPNRLPVSGNEAVTQVVLFGKKDSVTLATPLVRATRPIWVRKVPPGDLPGSSAHLFEDFDALPQGWHRSLAMAGILCRLSSQWMGAPSPAKRGRLGEGGPTVSCTLDDS